MRQDTPYRRRWYAAASNSTAHVCARLTESQSRNSNLAASEAHRAIFLLPSSLTARNPPKSGWKWAYSTEVQLPKLEEGDGLRTARILQDEFTVLRERHTEIAGNMRQSAALSCNHKYFP